MSNGWSVILLQRQESDSHVKPRGALFTGKLKYVASQDTFSPEHTVCFQNKHWHKLCLLSFEQFSSKLFRFSFFPSLLGPVPTD